MTMMNRSMQLVAAGRVTGGTGAVTSPSANSLRGFTVVRNGAGDYTITFDGALDATERVVELASRTALAHLHIGAETDTTVQVLSVTIVAGNAALDADFDFAIYRVAP